MRSILLCVDGSNYATPCAKYTIELARLMDAYVDILYVSDLQSFELSVVADFGGALGMQTFKELSDSKQSLENEKARRIERKLTRMFQSAHHDGKFKFNHRVGAIVDIFEEFKKGATGVDLIVLGKRGENSDAAKERLGATLEKVLRASTCPCLIVPNKFKALRKVLIAYDGSEPVNRALQFVERNAFFKDCEIHILAVNPDETVRDGLDKVRDLLRGMAKLDVVTCERVGEVGEEIDKYAREMHADLLIMGAYAHGAIRHLFVGSSTLEILRRSNIPVVAFR
ncbi:MAG: universal stress protein [Puniceicoccales bacterium]|nr:universal stress protein [Puniceicoccales bacterium]